MLNVKKWLAMLLALSLLFNLIPMNILADEPSLGSAEEFQTMGAETVVLDLPSEEVPDDGNDTPGEGDKTPEDGNTTPAEGDETSEEETSTPAEGNEPPEEGNTTPTEGDETPDESENVSAEVEETNNSIALYTMPTDSFAKAFADRLINAGIVTEDEIGSIIEENDTGIQLNISGQRISAWAGNSLPSASCKFWPRS